MTSMEKTACIACGGTLKVAIAPWLRRCASCGLWAAQTTEPADAGDVPALVEGRRTEALEPLRRHTFGQLLDTLAETMPLAGARVLDVGCAHGWFLELAVQRGMDAAGIEPDTSVAAVARARGLRVTLGRFPEDLDVADGAFDAIVFNDVFEHLPDPDAVLATCHRLLAPGGKLVLNFPDSDGILYRIACVIARLGIRSFLSRMWQLRFHSPHLHYFNARNLDGLVQRHGFAVLRRRTLATIRVHGLWSRLTMDRGVSRLRAALVYLALLGGYPLFSIAPADIRLQIYTKTSNV